jgi:NTP pyrophosphatase (non-canonical NTP hydrolase)
VELKDLQKQVHALAVEKGWWDGQINLPEKLCLVHSEISEALEEYRRGTIDLRDAYEGEGGKPEGFSVELADAVIRILDLCGWLGIDLEAEILRKHEYNKIRPYRHGGKTC